MSTAYFLLLYKDVQDTGKQSIFLQKVIRLFGSPK